MFALLLAAAGALLTWCAVPALPRLVPAAGHVVRHRAVAAALTALAFGALAWRFGPVPELPAYLALAAVCVPLVLIDVGARRLPNVLTLSAFATGTALLAVAAPLHHGGWRALAGALLGAAALAAGYLLLVLVNPSGMGLGDVKLALPLGLSLGWLGTATWALGALAGLLLGGLLSAALLLTGRVGRRSMLPYGPFMVAGALLAIVAGPRLLPLVTG